MRAGAKLKIFKIKNETLLRNTIPLQDDNTK